MDYVYKSAVKYLHSGGDLSEMQKHGTNYDPANRFQTYRLDGEINPNVKDLSAVNAAFNCINCMDDSRKSERARERKTRVNFYYPILKALV